MSISYEDLINEGREEVAISLQNKWVDSENEDLKNENQSLLKQITETNLDFTKV